MGGESNQGRHWGIAEKPPHKVVVPSTETKPELTGVDRYIRAKKKIGRAHV